MSKDLTNILASVTESIMEQVAFVFFDENGDASKPSASNWDAVGAKISYSGVQSGTIHLWISRELACNIASNMLALDNLDDSKKSEDAVMELCNIIAGNFITEAFQNSEISMEIPSLLSNDKLIQDVIDHNATWFSSEDEQILILLGEHD